MKPNVLFIIIDSLRSDKFSDHIKNRPNSNISKLMNRSVLFSDTISAWWKILVRN